MRPHGRARINRNHPQAQGICDRCGFPYTHKDLLWQFDWVGARLQNLRILVHEGCRDKPQENIRTIILPPDPIPIVNPRAENFVGANNPISGIGWDPTNFFAGIVGEPPGSAFFGTMVGGGGPDATFSGISGITTPSSFGLIAPPLVVTSVKPFILSANITPSSTAAAGNSVGINWSKIPGAPPTNPVAIGAAPAQGFNINSAIVVAPLDSAFLGTATPTTVALEGSSNGTTWTRLATKATLGTLGEVVTLSSSITTVFGFHRILVAGDGVGSAAISSIQLSATGPSAAQTASELGA